MTILPPYDDSAKQMTDQWLQQFRQKRRQECAQTSEDADLLHIAAWLDGRLSARDSDRVEGLLAADPALLATVLALRDYGSEPVAAAEVLHAQKLVSATMVSKSRRRWLLPALLNKGEINKRQINKWQPLSMAFGAMVSAAVIVCSVWLGGAAAYEFGVESMQTAALLEITQLDFGASNSIASTANGFE